MPRSDAIARIARRRFTRHPSSGPHRALLALCGAIVLLALLASHFRPHATATSHADTLVLEAVADLRKPEGKVQYLLSIVPGGEVLVLSPAMERLIQAGEAARPVLHDLLAEPDVGPEVAVVLGFVGDRTSIQRLIETFPEHHVTGADQRFGRPDSKRLICWTHALVQLTHEAIGHSRWGCDFAADNARLWRAWWATARHDYAVPTTRLKDSYAPIVLPSSAGTGSAPGG